MEMETPTVGLQPSQSLGRMRLVSAPSRCKVYDDLREVVVPFNTIIAGDKFPLVNGVIANGMLRPHPRRTEEIKDNAFSHLRVHGWLEHTEGPVLERRENFEFVCLSSRPQWRS